MKIWLINHYAVPPQYYPLARPSLFAKNLIKMGHDVTIIAASTVHNSDKNLIEGKEKIKKFSDDGIPYVLIRCSDYQGNGVKRVKNIIEFARKLPGVLDKLEKPDAIVATSFDPLTCYTGIKYAKNHGIKAVAEIADLWPETLVAYNGVSPSNPIVKYLRKIEKKIYTKADRIVFTMEGAYDYIVEQGWDEEIPKEKVYFINNGVDLKAFDYNRDHFHIDDDDLEDTKTFKVIYTGSIRRVNNLGLLLDVAKLVKNKRIRFLVWGDGDERNAIEKRIETEGISNVVYKGFVEKKYIPFITSKADLNIAHNSSSPLFKYGISFNKIFDYMAARKPILCDFPSDYNPVILWDAGIGVSDPSPFAISEKIEELSRLKDEELMLFGLNARKASEQVYNFVSLTDKLIDILKTNDEQTYK